MEINPEQGQQREIYRLVRENNKMLHAMRRNAFWGSIIKFIIYAALILAPLWFYMQYLAPIMQDLMHAVEQVQGTGAKAQAQFGGFQELLQQLQSKLGIFGGGATTSTR